MSLHKALVMLLLFGLILFQLAILANIPSWYIDDGLPLYPAILLGEVVGASFILCLVGIFELALQPILARRRLTRLLHASPVKRWEWRRDWAQGKVTHSDLKKTFFPWLFIVNWWGGIWFFAQGRGAELFDQPISIQMLFGAFIIVGLAIVYSAILRTISWLHFGRSSLFIKTLPGRPGGFFEGSIVTHPTQKPCATAHITIAAFERRWSQNVDSSDEYTKAANVRDDAPFYHKQIELEPRLLSSEPGKLTIPVRLSIPDNAPNSGPVSPQVEIIWRIYICFTGAEDPNYKASFEVPIYSIPKVLEKGSM